MVKYYYLDNYGLTIVIVNRWLEDAYRHELAEAPFGKWLQGLNIYVRTYR